MNNKIEIQMKEEGADLLPPALGSVASETEHLMGLEVKEDNLLATEKEEDKGRPRSRVEKKG